MGYGEWQINRAAYRRRPTQIKANMRKDQIDETLVLRILEMFSSTSRKWERTFGQD